MIISLLTILTAGFIPASASAQTDTKPLVLEIKSIPNIPDVQTIHNFTKNRQQPQETIITDPITINTPILQDYLEQKGSPLASSAAELLKNDNWKLVLAISNGESTMCKRQMYNNCWGVGGAWNLRRYASFADGFADVDRLLASKYIPSGKDTPVKIVRKYVGSYSPNWVLAVNQTLAELDKLPLQN
jgi:hypothetical protein